MDQSWISSWGWVALALINAGLAEQKNRTRLGWFLGSLFVGPLATAYIVIAAPAPPSDDLDMTPRRASDDPGYVILGVGLAIVALATLPAIWAAVSASWQLWAVTGVVAAAGVTLVVVHVLARRRWRARRDRDASL
jgi:uncharacterized protein (DUF983 family)